VAGPIFALAVMVGLWGWREVEHNAAVQLASTASMDRWEMLLLRQCYG